MNVSDVPPYRFEVIPLVQLAENCIYFLEEGFGVRSSKVTYDRKGSAFAEYDFSKLDFKKILKGFNWLHTSGITCASAVPDSAFNFLQSIVQRSQAVAYGYGKF